MGKIHYEITWDPQGGEYVAVSPQVPDVSGHSRHPGCAFVALLAKLLELGHINDTDWRGTVEDAGIVCYQDGCEKQAIEDSDYCEDHQG